MVYIYIANLFGNNRDVPRQRLIRSSRQLIEDLMSELSQSFGEIVENAKTPQPSSAHRVIPCRVPMTRVAADQNTHEIHFYAIAVCIGPRECLRRMQQCCIWPPPGL